jgi:hypothetical protein
VLIKKRKKALGAVAGAALVALPLALDPPAVSAEEGVHRDSATHTYEINYFGGDAITCAVKVESVLDFNTHRFFSRTDILASDISDPCVTQVNVSISYPEEDGGHARVSASGIGFAYVEVNDVAEPYVSRSYTATHGALYNYCEPVICVPSWTTNPK